MSDVDPAIRRHLSELAATIHRHLLDTPGDVDDGHVRNRVIASAPMCSRDELDLLTELVDEQLHGLGPLEVFLAEPDVTEVMVNGPGPVWVERHGVITKTDVTVDRQMLQMIVDRIIARRGVRLDRLVPFADARLGDGSRVHVTVPPMAIDGPYLTIRRFGEVCHTFADFAEGPVVALLELAVAAKANILVCGPTGAGKTSLLNALGAHFAPAERVVTIEDAAELRLPGSHVVRLESRPANAEGAGELTMRTLVRNALRMRPDRIVVGEVRGAEAFDMVQALNTGHRGSLATCHANSTADARHRVASMMLMADLGMPADLVAAQVDSAFDLVIAVDRIDGRRRVDRVQGATNGQLVVLVDRGRVTEPGRAWHPHPGGS